MVLPYFGASAAFGQKVSFVSFCRAECSITFYFLASGWALPWGKTLFKQWTMLSLPSLHRRRSLWWRCSARKKIPRGVFWSAFALIKMIPIKSRCEEFEGELASIREDVIDSLEDGWVVKSVISIMIILMSQQLQKLQSAGWSSRWDAIHPRDLHHHHSPVTVERFVSWMV